MATLHIKLATVQNAAPQPATTAMKKAMSAANALLPRKKRHATAAVNRGISHANAHSLGAWAVEWEVATVEEEAKNATSAVN